MAKVVLENVYKTYRGDHGHDVNAVTDVSLTIEDEEFIVFVGPSGCGKSTTLRMIAGLEEISSGHIHIGGRCVNDVAPKDRDIAMVFQNYALYPHMSVYQNMAFGLQLRRQPKAEIDRRVNEAAQILGLSREMLERKPKALSGGQRQRVALGRAIVRKPSVFLFDEPLSNLDAAMRVQMRTEISKLHAQLASTMIYVTHDQVEAMTMGDRIVVMKNGLIQQVAEPLALYHDPANMFVASFIGSPAINFFQGTIEIDRGAVYFVKKGEDGSGHEIKLRLTDDQARTMEPHQGQETFFGIRPEHVRPSTRGAEADSGRLILARVEVVEPLGPETYVYLKVGSSSFTARFPETRRDEIEAKIQIIVDMEKGFFFNVADTSAFLQQQTGAIDVDSWRTACKRLA